MRSSALVCLLESLVHFMENCEDRFGNGNHLFFVSFFLFFLLLTKEESERGNVFRPSCCSFVLFIDEISIHAVVKVCGFLYNRKEIDSSFPDIGRHRKIRENTNVVWFIFSCPFSRYSILKLILSEFVPFFTWYSSHMSWWLGIIKSRSDRHLTCSFRVKREIGFPCLWCREFSRFCKTISSHHQRSWFSYCSSVWLGSAFLMNRWKGLNFEHCRFFYLLQKYFCLNLDRNLMGG
jgi:hypothetical protein